MVSGRMAGWQSDFQLGPGECLNSTSPGGNTCDQRRWLCVRCFSSSVSASRRNGFITTSAAAAADAEEEAAPAPAPSSDTAGPVKASPAPGPAPAPRPAPPAPPALLREPSDASDARLERLPPRRSRLSMPAPVPVPPAPPPPEGRIPGMTGVVPAVRLPEVARLKGSTIPGETPPMSSWCCAGLIGGRSDDDEKLPDGRAEEEEEAPAPALADPGRNDT